MPRGILFFVIVWVLVGVGITTFRHLNGQEKLTVVKLVGFSAVTAVIALVIVVGMVALF